MKRLIKKLKEINWNRSVEVKSKIGIDTIIIEVWPAGSIHPESRSFTIKWFIFYIEFSAECKG